MKYLFGLIFLLLSQSSAYAQERFYIDGDVLYFDSDVITGTETDDISWGDVDEIEYILSKNDAITSLTINSAGGYISAARYISDLIIDYDLDVNVKGTCESACTIIFLGGNKRTIEKGSWLGFHRSYWAASSMEDYYYRLQDEEGWGDPFEFASQMYEETQEEILDDLKFFIERQVSADFAIRTMQADTDDMWYPRRKELEEAGVIKPFRD